MAKRNATKGNGTAHVGAEDFVKAWAKGGTIADVAERLGISPGSVASRGANYRKRGVELPKLDRQSRSGLDVERLNALLK